MKNRVKEFRELQNLREQLNESQGKRLEQLESSSRIVFYCLAGLGGFMSILFLIRLFS